MNVTGLTVTVTDPKQVAAILASLAGKRKPGRPPKAEVEAEEADADEEEAEEDSDQDEEEADEDGDEGEESDEADEEAEDEKPAKAAKGLDPAVEKKLIKAFQAYATKHTRAKALKLLTKFGAKNVKSLPPAKVKAVLAALAK